VTTICVLYPELLGTYGDGGNGLAVAERARRRGFEVELVTAGLNDEVPDAALYLLGGGEDGPQRLAADLLRSSSFSDRVHNGAQVVAVCAGLQILGLSFCVEGNDEYEGLGLVDVVTSRGERRSVGELATRVEGQLLVGFENHGGRTTLHGGVAPLGTVVKGRGNDAKFDGYRTKNIWATYAHGPVLAMNPWFCDEILGAVLDRELEPICSMPSAAEY
jgi:lipid II isoglutaminyl synthase (glutamine-hydrolysing)